MRFLRSLLPSLLLLGAGVAEAASSWNFDEAVISVTGKGNAAAAFKDKYVDSFTFPKWPFTNVN
jgi:oligosaccharyltransferase complex subunit delta (ribophorin II)